MNMYRLFSICLVFMLSCSPKLTKQNIALQESMKTELIRLRSEIATIDQERKEYVTETVYDTVGRVMTVKNTIIDQKTGTVIVVNDSTTVSVDRDTDLKIKQKWTIDIKIWGLILSLIAVALSLGTIFQKR